MAKKDKRQIFNSARRLPIVFCLDVSPSMGWRIGNNRASIELLNDAVNQFVDELREDVRACSGAEIAFVTFTDEVIMNTDFESISSIPRQTFKAVEDGGTSLAKAVLVAFDKIEEHRQRLADAEIPCYAPFFVLVTDGDPDETDDEERMLERKALKEIKSHCMDGIPSSEFVVPFIIGVGDHVNPDTLNRYASGIGPGYFPIKGNNTDASMRFGKVFRMIRNSASLNFRPAAQSDMLDMIQNNMDALFQDLLGE